VKVAPPLSKLFKINMIWPQNGHKEFLSEWTVHLNSPAMYESEVESLKPEAQQHLKLLKRKALVLNITFLFYTV